MGFLEDMKKYEEEKRKAEQKLELEEESEMVLLLDADGKTEPIDKENLKPGDRYVENGEVKIYESQKDEEDDEYEISPLSPTDPLSPFANLIELKGHELPFSEQEIERAREEAVLKEAEERAKRQEEEKIKKETDSLWNMGEKKPGKRK